MTIQEDCAVALFLDVGNRHEQGWFHVHSTVKTENSYETVDNFAVERHMVWRLSLRIVKESAYGFGRLIEQR